MGRSEIDVSELSPVVQFVHAGTHNQISLNTVLPRDDTAPQSSEGDEVITLAITPKHADNILLIEFSTFGDVGGNLGLSAALFQDSTVAAISAISFAWQGTGGGGAVESGMLRHIMTAGTTSATTFKIRCGPSTGTTGTINPQDFGILAATWLTITEYLVTA